MIVSHEACLCLFSEGFWIKDPGKALDIVFSYFKVLQCLSFFTLTFSAIASAALLFSVISSLCSLNELIPRVNAGKFEVFYRFSFMKHLIYFLMRGFTDLSGYQRVHTCGVWLINNV